MAMRPCVCDPSRAPRQGAVRAAEGGDGIEEPCLGAVRQSSVSRQDGPGLVGLRPECWLAGAVKEGGADMCRHAGIAGASPGASASAVCVSGLRLVLAWLACLG
jgi:hypothetical protein